MSWVVRGFVATALVAGWCGAVRADSGDFAPPPVDAPQIRNLEPRTRIYLDGTYARSADLSGLPYTGGSGHNYRAALGGSLRLGRFQVDVELPASQATTVDLTMIPPPPGRVPLEEDAHQTATSIGDLRLGAQWSTRVPLEDLSLAAGLALRVRIPTHTTTYQFHLIDGSLAPFGLPPYFHIEPTALLGAEIGPLSFVTNQGLLALAGPNFPFVGILFVLPTVYFWDAHYALATGIGRYVGLSLEANTVVQLNHVNGDDFKQLNGLQAIYLIPAVQLVLDAWRVDAVMRWGVTRSAELFGVVAFAGARSFTLRLSRTFDWP